MHVSLGFRISCLVLFQEVKHTTHILGIFHTASNPAKWRRRIDE
jgi:hypothetical protein